MNLFYAPDLLPDASRYVFDKAESRHISKVLRKLPGDTLQLTDGKGGWYEAIIIKADPKETMVQIRWHAQLKRRNYRIHVAMAPTKSNDRFEWFLEKATEMGIDTITPLLTAHSERKKINKERYEKIIVAAMKQSLQAFKPQLNDMTSWKSFLDQIRDTDDQKTIAYCRAKQPLKEVLTGSNDILILIGPEGGFSNEELTQAKLAGFEPVLLSPNRLRTETAGMVAVASVHLILD